MIIRVIAVLNRHVLTVTDVSTTCSVVIFASRDGFGVLTDEEEKISLFLK